MVQYLAPAFGSGDGYIEIILDLVLPDEVAEASGSEIGIK